MKTTLRLLYMCVSLLLCGCESVVWQTLMVGITKNTHWGESYHKSFVENYYVIDRHDELEFYPGVRTVEVCLPYKVYAAQSTAYDDYYNARERHEELSLKYDDIYFNTWVSGDQNTGSSWAFPFYAFTIVSDTDFDEEHPAGTPLNDVVDIKYYTYRLYIENGYKHTDERAMTSNDYSGDWVTKRLSDLAPEDAIFMDPQAPFHLSFVSSPTLNRQHRITVTVWLETRQPYTFEFDMDFGDTSDL